METEIFQLDRWGGVQVVVGAVVVVVLTGLVLSWISQRRYGGGGGRRLPPGPKGWPLLGALPYLGEFPHKSLYELSKKYGPVMYMRLSSVSALVISSAEMAKEVLKTNDHVFASRPEMLVPTCLTGQKDISFSPYGPYWRQIRKLSVVQLLTNSKVAHFTGIVKEEILTTIHIALEKSQSGGGKDGPGVEVNVTALSRGMTMNNITRIMWSKRHRNIEGSHQSHVHEKFDLISKAVELFSSFGIIVDFLPFFKSAAMELSGLGKKARKVHEELDKFCELVICEKEEALSKKPKAEAEAVADEDDFVTTMLKLINQPEDSEGLSRENIKAIVTDLMLAAADTNAVTFDWTLAELMKNPEMMKKVQDELTEVVGEDRLVSESDIPHLKYLDAVLKEVLRKHAPGPLGIPHLSMANCKIGGYDIPANTWLFVNQYAVHHDTTFWENPWEFNPDRFLQSDLDFRGQHFDFLPFGSGRRACPGISLASNFLHIALAQFIHTVKWSLPAGQEPENMDMSEKSTLVITRASPLFVTAKPRLAHHVIYPTRA